MSFTFNAARHEYASHGRVVPSVTGALHAAGYSDFEFATEEGKVRGRAVHEATLEWDLVGGPLPRLRPSWQGYLDAYARFRDEVACEWTEMEEPKFCAAYGFAGTRDRVGTIARCPAIGDLKTAQSGARVDWHGYQLAGYDLMDCVVRGARRRYAIYLMPDGKYKLRLYDSAADYINFLEALNRHGRQQQAALA